eukprot:TRINITY_DN9492_c0_g4_i1.p2 TRINITY_DN9492_c0_g4~~TRINITY_DN9492_c0_g4_i1.p2  ORF type:complete len:243 (-),score=53.10 TRINITY_DN9492_c0_g4_i1:92-820(-)
MGDRGGRYRGGGRGDYGGGRRGGRGDYGDGGGRGRGDRGRGFGGRGDGRGRGRGRGPTLRQLLAAEGSEQNMTIMRRVGEQRQATRPNYPTVSQEQLRKSGLSNEEIERLRRLGFPTRPDDGQEGRQIKVLTNLFLLRVDVPECFHHDIAIMDEAMWKRAQEAQQVEGEEAIEGNIPLPVSKCVQIIERLAHQQGWPNGWAYDGRKNIFAVYTLLKNPPENTSYKEVFDVEVQSGVNQILNM